MVFGSQVEGVWGNPGLGMYLVLSQTSEEVFYVMISYNEASATAPNNNSAKSLYKILMNTYHQGMQLYIYS